MFQASPVESSALSIEFLSALSPHAMTPIMLSSKPKVGGTSEASNTPRRQLDQAQI